MVCTRIKNSSANWAAALTLALFLYPLAMAGQTVTLEWKPSPSPGVAGYLVFCGTNGTAFDSQIDVGSNTIVTVTDLQPGCTNYFEVVAYDTNFVESPPSRLLQYSVPSATQTLTVTPNSASAGNVAGGGTFATGSSVTVTATANSGYAFANWTDNGVVQSTSPSYTLTLNSSCNLVANFTLIPVSWTVAAEVTPASAGSVTGAGTFSPGSSVTVSATANSGYTFADWTENEIIQSASPSYTLTLTTNRNLVANFTVNRVLCAVATQASPSSGGTVIGAGTFNTGTFITVTATAKAGYTFTNWTVNGIVQTTTPSYAFTVTNNVNLVANFTLIPVNYTVAAQVTPANAGTVAGGGTFLSGSPVTVTASANSGYIFANWTENGIVQGTSPSYSFALATNRNLVANFAAVYTVATQIYPVNAGSVTGGGTFTAGASVTVTATANSGYTFTNWSENGVVQSASPSYNFTLATNRNLVANFTLNPVTYTVAAQANPAGAGSVIGEGTFSSGTSVTVTAAANSGYTFTNWTENGIVQGTSLNYGFTLTTNRNLVANFTVNPVTYSVATQIYPVNAGNVTGGGTFVTGSSVTVTAAANSGYTFTNWTENGIVQSASPSYAFALATNRNLVANFTVNPTTFAVATQVNPANAGVLSGGGTFATGSLVTVSATANSGYTFTNWTENGIVQSASPSYSFTLTTNRNLVANFTINSVAFTVATQVSPASAGNVTGGGTYASGSSVMVAATANSGYSFTNWTLNGIVQGTSPSYTFILATNCNMVANFAVAPVTYAVAAQASPAYAGSVSGGGTFASGSSVTMLATTNSGFTFTDWTENGIVQSPSPSYNFTLTTNRNLVANFVPVSYAVVTQVNPSDAGSVSGGGTFSVGTSVTVTAAANGGYTFTNWTENGVVQSTLTNYTFTLATNRNLVANFIANPVAYSVATQIYPVNAGSVSGGGTFTAGSSITVTATANSGYTFTNWTENGIIQSTSAGYTFTLAANRNLVANFTVTPSTYTVATQAWPANAGSVSGGGSFNIGTFVTVTAAANSGYTFTNWTENGIVQSGSLSYSFTLATNRNLVANFVVTPVSYTVTPQVSPVNAGNVTGGGTFTSGSSVTVTATANSGYTFTNWTQNGIVQSTSPSYTFALTANCNLVANFTTTPVMYTVAAQLTPASAGTVIGGGTFLSGSPVTVTATANSGYTFTNWTENGIVQSASPSYSFTLVTNRNLVANFTVNPILYTVQTQISPINAGIVTGDGTFAPGTSVTVTAVANSAYTFTNWTENGIVQSTSPSYSFALATNRNLVANFAVNSVTFTVTPNSGTNGSITPVGPQTVPQGSNVTFYVTPIGNYQVNQWLVNGAAVQNGGISYTLLNVRSNSTVSVSFSVKPSNFMLLISGNGTVSPNLKTFKQGARYTVTAIPANGSVFADWTSNGIAVTSAPRYTFLVESNVVLQANFVSNPFTAVAGNFDGLFYDTNNSAGDSSGSITASVTKSGTYTARISLGGLSYALSGQFSVAGAVSKSILRPGSSPLTVQLQLGSSGAPMTGTIGDGVWTANLEADPARYSAINRSPQAGRYTLLIPGSSAASTQPGGNGFGTLTVSETGSAILSGTLGDGTPVFSSSIVCSQGEWPLYASLYGGKGSLLGWLSFTNYGNIGGQIAWFKLPQKTAKFYSSGFTNTTEVIGSSYKYTQGFPILGYAYASLSLINGDLSGRINDEIGIWPGVLSFNQNGSKLTFNSISGLFNGTVANPVTGKPITVNGVVLQYQDFAGGLFLGTNQTGSVVLSRGE